MLQPSRQNASLLDGLDGLEDEPCKGDQPSYVTPAGHSWYSVENRGSLKIGDVAVVNPGEDFIRGGHALSQQGRDWIHLVLLKDGGEAESEIRNIRALHSGMTRAQGVPLKATLNAETGGDAVGAAGGEGTEDVRTLWIDYDEHGERFKPWREVCKESYLPNLTDRESQGPITTLNLIKHWLKNGGDPRLWFQNFCHNKWIERTDRMFHEMETLINAFYAFETIDQVNLPALEGVEILARRLQSMVEAYSINPARPSWENAKVWTGRGDPDDCCDPAFKVYAARKNREEVELVQARQKVRDLRGAPDVGDIGGGDDRAKANAKSKVEAKGASKKGATGRRKRALAPDAGDGS